MPGSPQVSGYQWQQLEQLPEPPVPQEQRQRKYRWAGSCPGSEPGSPGSRCSHPPRGTCRVFPRESRDQAILRHCHHSTLSCYYHSSGPDDMCGLYMSLILTKTLEAGISSLGLQITETRLK